MTRNVADVFDQASAILCQAGQNMAEIKMDAVLDPLVNSKGLSAICPKKPFTVQFKLAHCGFGAGYREPENTQKA